MAPFQDRISSLHDDLIFKIISSLPFKEAVRTTVLAKRWGSVVPGIKKMEFRERNFVSARYDSFIKKIQRKDFVAFLLRWMSKSNPGPLKTFSLAFSDPQDFQAQLQQCIAFAIGRNVEVFDFDFSNPEWDESDVENYYNRIQTAVQLPLLRASDLTALKTLNLCSCYFPNPADVSSGLRSVSLAWIKIGTSEMRSMIERATFLETLSMRNCCYASGNVKIVSESLTSLVMENCRSASGPDSKLNLELEAPEMKRFDYSGVLFTLCCTSQNLDLDATLDFGLQREFYGSGGDTLHGILHDVGGVKTLTVCTYLLQVINNTEQEAKLERLEYLTLKASLSQDEYFGITYLLKSCPNLKLLTIDLNSPPRVFQDYEALSDIRHHEFLNQYTAIAYPCMSTTLKEIEVKGFRGTENEMVVLRYLLEYCKVLERLEISISQQRGGPFGGTMEDVYVARVYSLLRNRNRVANKRNLELILNLKP